MAELDLVVIGAGPGGYVAAIRAAQLGVRTAVVEQESAGGVCGNWGCIPSKAILADAELYGELRDGQARGIVADGLRVDFARVLARSRAVATRQAQGVESLFRKHHVDLVSHGVTELVGEAGLALALEATTNELRDTVHAHPTLSEALREAALAAQGEAVNI